MIQPTSSTRYITPSDLPTVEAVDQEIATLRTEHADLWKPYKAASDAHQRKMLTLGAGIGIVGAWLSAELSGIAWARSREP